MKLEHLLNGRTRKKIANNTYALRLDSGAVAIRLHGTIILQEEKETGTFVIHSGGWRTRTTKDRLNAYLPFGYGLHQRRGLWYWNTSCVFTDGDCISSDGVLETISGCHDTPAKEKESYALTKKINAFAKLCGDSLPLSPPSGADCWYCAMRTEAGEPLGTTRNHSHLLYHMEENYIVPSLVLNALNRIHASDYVKAVAFGAGGSIGPVDNIVRRAVSAYLKVRLGIAR